MSYVLDASALLAYLHQERGWERVQELIDASCISAVNWSEVAQKTMQVGLNAGDARTMLLEIGLSVEPFSLAQSESAAELWMKTRHRGLSLADRACLALAAEKQVPAVTADRNWNELDVGIKIELLR